jgi:hypothetical protein
MKNTLLVIGGLYSFAFAAFHMLFWKLFRWKGDLQRLTPVNRAIMQVLNLRLIYVFVIMGLTTVLFPGPLLATDLGRFVLGAMSLFWLMRAIEQIIFFGLRATASIAIFGVFLIGSGIFGVLAFM